MADPERKVIEKVGKLMVALRETQAKCYELTEEIQTLLSGGAGIAAVMKRIETRYDLTWCARYAPGQSGRYVWSFSKDRAQLKRLLKSLSPDEIEERIHNYLKSNDEFYARARHPFLLFAASVNSHASPAERPREVPWSCPHEPNCGNRTTCAVVSARPREKQVFKGEHVL